MLASEALLYSLLSWICIIRSVTFLRGIFQRYNAHVPEDFSTTSDAGSHLMPMVVIIFARDSRCSGVSQTHDCQARLHLQLRHLLWLQLSHPITVWDYYRTATRLCTYARVWAHSPCLIRHQSVHSYPHTFGPSDSCPLLTGQTACGADPKRYKPENRY